MNNEWSRVEIINSTCDNFLSFFLSLAFFSLSLVCCCRFALCRYLSSVVASNRTPVDNEEALVNKLRVKVAKSAKTSEEAMKEFFLKINETPNDTSNN